MIDALGEPQSVLVLGGTSEIALATIKEMPRHRLRRVLLAGRPSPALDAAVKELQELNIAGVESVEFDAKNTDSHGAIIDAVFDVSDVDLVILAFGVLGDQLNAEADPSHAVEIATVNYTGAVSAGLHVARRLKNQGHGALVVLSSVAGDRARRSNYVYGSTKAGLDAFAQGLDAALAGTGAHVLIVRPGFVRTKMTTHLPEAPMTTNPEDVAAIIVSALRKGKSTVYAPGPLRFVMAGLKILPKQVFRKLPS
ncbi:MAG: decaprenylphospho-beta-D-erythro-pentofuranosid-2-ulose 2-reductase [Candidatus Nanopelagicales bacterium]|nr:decaprenylphospho-beta-D-erythro-pentofuranosid-2-ulose 2-reductase [Candidatus Nanopelagicales bacterium]MCF8539805.1 decaprenylphospho-beta-D-erythro-pentofuranosid-2-ulose 2-reductase [Candidatus Nanopelagicales bacterium]MCF8551132.1 decaprenylphospho-beta-D-erythro-pentofuranosid-2-ulose 2-reductase [Candidatus Nanopelagicales bacterium]